MPQSHALLERDAELGAISGALASAVQGRGQVLVLDGPAGAGKTALLDAARAQAEGAGLRVLRARGAELEREFGFGVVRQLFEGAPATSFTGAARFAAPLLGVELDNAPSPAANDPFAARHALYWLTANLAAEAPLALLVDDAHWADPASLGVLAHIANRVDSIAIALVVASRAEVSRPGLDDLRRGTVLAVPPLSYPAAASVVRSLAPRVDDALCRACHEATGGNPFLLTELARSLLAGERVADQSPERVTREIAARLARLPGRARALARATAVLGDGTPLRQAAALAGLDEDDAVGAADQLIAGGVLRSAHPLEFLHPLIGAAVYAGIGEAARSREHMRAARVLASDGVSAERVAAQLLRCEPAGDAWAYEQLVAAARVATERCAADAVASYLARALAEPAPPERRAGLLLELAFAESQFDPASAVRHLYEVLAHELSLDGRFRATMLLAGVLGQTGQVTAAADMIEAQFDAFAQRPELRGSMEAALANITRIDPRTRRRADDAIARMRARVDAGTERDPAVIGTIAAELAMAGEPAATLAEVAERALLGMRGEATMAAGWSWYNAIRSLVVGERYELARRLLDDALERARARGAVMDVGGVLTFRSELLVHVGDLAGAEVDARTLREITLGYGWPLGLGMSLATLGEVLLERGELEQADAVLGDQPVPESYMYIWMQRVRGRLRLAQGRPDDAVEELRECGRRADALDTLNPAVLPWRSDLALALTELGLTTEARGLALDELQRARAFGGRRALGIALRAAGRITGEIAMLHEATAALDASGAQLERARAHAELGAALRRAGDLEPARERLRFAIDLAHRCGAHAIEDRALAELRATGARPRRRLATGAGALTPSERRIAELAASGHQNREIAETLFVTTATVEYHLRNAYRKLEIGSRRQLAEALA